MNLYDRDTPGPYTPPRPPNPRAPKRMPRWAKFVVLAAAVPMAAAGAVVAVLVGPGLAQQTADRSPVISTASPTPAPTTYRPRQAQTEEAPDPAKARTVIYLATVRNEYPQAVAITDDTLVGLATSACSVFEAGGSWADIALALLDGPDSDVENAPVLAYAVGAGVAVFCPEYASRIPGAQ